MPGTAKSNRPKDYRKKQNRKSTALWRERNAMKDQAIVDDFNSALAQQNLPLVSLTLKHEYKMRGKPRPNYDPPPEMLKHMDPKDVSEWKARERRKRKAAKQRENRLLKKQMVEHMKSQLELAKNTSESNGLEIDDKKVLPLKVESNIAVFSEPAKLPVLVDKFQISNESESEENIVQPQVVSNFAGFPESAKMPGFVSKVQKTNVEHKVEAVEPFKIGSVDVSGPKEAEKLELKNEDHQMNNANTAGKTTVCLKFEFAVGGRPDEAGLLEFVNQVKRQVEAQSEEKATVSLEVGSAVACSPGAAANCTDANDDNIDELSMSSDTFACPHEGFSLLEDLDLGFENIDYKDEQSNDIAIPEPSICDDPIRAEDLLDEDVFKELFNL